MYDYDKMYNLTNKKQNLDQINNIYYNLIN